MGEYASAFGPAEGAGQPRRVPLALFVGVLTSVAGGLAWALVVISTRADVGFIAALIGVATGTVIVKVAGGVLAPPIRAFAGACAGASILLGKYVIFVHATKVYVAKTYGASAGRAVHYSDTTLMSYFLHHFDTVVRPVDYLWIGLAVVAAIRVSGASSRVAAVPRRFSPSPLNAPPLFGRAFVEAELAKGLPAEDAIRALVGSGWPESDARVLVTGVRWSALPINDAPVTPWWERDLFRWRRTTRVHPSYETSIWRRPVGASRSARAAPLSTRQFALDRLAAGEQGDEVIEALERSGMGRAAATRVVERAADR
jgi:hypothetical protein